MKFGVYSIYDSAAATFTAPTIDTSDSAALRGFQRALASPESIMNFKPDDFTLYQVGLFDVESGLLEPMVPPSRIFVGESGYTEKEIKK